MQDQTYHSTVPPIRVCVGIIWLDNASIAGLKVLSSRWLHLDNRLISARRTAARSLAVDVAHGACVVDRTGIVEKWLVGRCGRCSRLGDTAGGAV